ncbi:MAG: hypothetical protein AAGN82_11695 [Myxococcota bacterium]
MNRTSHFASLSFLLLLIPAAKSDGCLDDEVVIGDDQSTGGDEHTTTGSGAGGDEHTTTGSGVGGDEGTTVGSGAGGEGTTVGSGGGAGCFIGGCSNQLCTSDPNRGSTCEWLDEYACYQQLGVCEGDANGGCGWRQSPDLVACIDAAREARTPYTDQCTRNAGDTCATDADCAIGGCGNEVCFNPQESGGTSTCDCAPSPTDGCGCVNGTCSWYTAN